MWRRRLLTVFYPALRAGVFVLGRLPTTAGYGLADALARLCFRLDGKRRRRGLRNVARAFPERSPEEHAAILRGTYRNLLRLAYDLTLMGRKLRPGTGETIAFEGGEHVTGHPPDRGMVCTTAHVGAWEVLGASMHLLGRPATSVAKGVDEGVYERFLRRLREVHGQRIISFAGAVKEGRTLVQSGAALAFVADQHAPVSRIWVPFFGVPSSFVKTPAGLARRYGVPLLVGFCRRTGPGFRFQATFYPLIHPDPEAPVRLDIARMTRTYVQYLEAYVRAHPEDYLWLHRLWRRPVEGEEAVQRDGTYVRNASFGSDAAQASSDREPDEPGAPQRAGQGDRS